MSKKKPVELEGALLALEKVCPKIDQSDLDFCWSVGEVGEVAMENGVYSEWIAELEEESL